MQISLIRRALVSGVLACAAGSALFGATAHAQGADFPTKPIRFIVPYPPGGPLDTMGRMLADKVRDTLGQTVIVENRSGAGGNIGLDLVAKAEPDGYVLGMGAVATLAINPWLYATLPFDPAKDFRPVALVASVPNVLIVNGEFADKEGIKTVADLAEYARKNPGRLNNASGGNGSAGHLAGALFNARAGVDTMHIPYQGAAPAKLALLSGEAHMMFDNLASAAPLIKEGKVRALAVTTSQRSSQLADVPTMEQAGVQDFDIGTWFGVVTTGNVPDAVLAKLGAAYDTALRLPDVRSTLATMGSESEPISPEAFAEFAAKEREKYREIVKISGASIN